MCGRNVGADEKIMYLSNCKWLLHEAVDRIPGKNMTLKSTNQKCAMRGIPLMIMYAEVQQETTLKTEGCYGNIQSFIVEEISIT